MEEYIINGKAIYTPKGAALEYGRVGCNFYTGCPHDCEYCYLKRGAPSKQLGGKEVKLKKCFKDKDYALATFRREVSMHLDTLRKYGIFFSFTTDPMIPETIDLTIRALEICIAYGIPAKILTKNANWLDSPGVKNLFNEIHKADADIRFGFTLTGRDDMEPKASPNQWRIDAMAQLKEYGIKTWASIEPVIDWYSSIGVIEKSLPFCDHYKIGLRSGVGRAYYNDVTLVKYIGFMVGTIANAGHTVYIKESVRKRLLGAMTIASYEGLLSKTVDMDGNPINWI